MTTSARRLSRKIGNQPSRTARRKPASAARKRKAQPAPRFSRITRNLTVTPPDDCKASVIFKLVAHDDARRFAYWLLVGRHDQDAVEARYKFTGESTLRCDVPFGAQLTPDALQPYLVDFLESEGTEPDGPPILDGKEN
jgi:hypothetical protein